MYFPIEGWFTAFVITLTVEVPVVIVLARRLEPNLVRLGLLVLFANLATHPIVWYVVPQLLLVGTNPYVVVAETWAVVAEAVFYGITIRRISARRAIALAFAANAASFLAGRLIGAVWPDLLR
jgi:hypothetical protein